MLIPKQIVTTFTNKVERHVLGTYYSTMSVFPAPLSNWIPALFVFSFQSHGRATLEGHSCGYSFAVIPVTWRNRKTGIAKLKIREMGSRYLFIVLYLWLEKYFSRGDYHKS